MPKTVLQVGFTRCEVCGGLFAILISHGRTGKCLVQDAASLEALPIMISAVWAILDAYDGKSRDVGRVRDDGRASSRGQGRVCLCPVVSAFLSTHTTLSPASLHFPPSRCHRPRTRPIAPQHADCPDISKCPASQFRGCRPTTPIPV
jgi:hypothetical protein